MAFVLLAAFVSCVLDLNLGKRGYLVLELDDAVLVVAVVAMVNVDPYKYFCRRLHSSHQVLQNGFSKI